MKKSKQRQKKRRADLRFVCIMLSIPILQFCLMWVGVNFNSILLAFKQYDINYDYTWTLNNFTRVINELKTNQGIIESMWNSVIFWISTSVLTLPVALLISYYLYKRYRFHGTLKTAFFIPSLMAGIVTVTVFYILVDRGYPMIMERLFGRSELGLLINSKTQFGTVLFYNIFYSLAQGFLYLSSAMSSVDDGLSEAAQIDGATPLQEFLHVTLPCIYPTLSVYFIASIPAMFVNDFGLFGFFKTAGSSVFSVMGSYFMVGLTEWGEREYPYFSAFGLILSVFACIITFSLKAIINRMDPFADQDGSKAKARREKKNKRRGKHA